jgi:hypothetical protein
MLFCKLPPELLTRILYFCDAQSAIKCGMVRRSLAINQRTRKSVLSCNLQTCKRAHEAAQTSEVQYSILLDVCEMVDSGSLMPIAERLGRLCSYERAWSTLSWTECLQVPLSSLPAISEHHRDGVLASLEHVPRKGCFRVVCHRWSSLLRGVAYNTWAWTFLGPVNNSSVLRIDPKNDLAVILSHFRTDSGEFQTRCVWRLLCPTKAVSDHFCRSVYPCTLSSGGVHPLSSKSYIIFPNEIDFYGLIFQKLEGGRLIARNTSDAHGNIVIYSWLTGSVQLVRYTRLRQASSKSALHRYLMTPGSRRLRSLDRTTLLRPVTHVGISPYSALGDSSPKHRTSFICVSR